MQISCPCAGRLPKRSSLAARSSLCLQPLSLRHLFATSRTPTASRRRTHVCASAAAAPPAGKLLGSSVISAFIPRQDLIDQMLRWAQIDAQDQGVANFGLPMTVKPTFKDEDELWGFTVAIHNREGDVLTEISVRMDNDTVDRREHVGRGADGFPLLKGETLTVEGKNLEIRKLDENPVDERLRSVIKSFCQSLMEAINRYYAFGSPFVDDAQ